MHLKMLVMEVHYNILSSIETQKKMHAQIRINAFTFYILQLIKNVNLMPNHQPDSIDVVRPTIMKPDLIAFFLRQQAYSTGQSHPFVHQKHLACTRHPLDTPVELGISWQKRQPPTVARVWKISSFINHGATDIKFRCEPSNRRECWLRFAYAIISGAHFFCIVFAQVM